MAKTAAQLDAEIDAFIRGDARTGVPHPPTRKSDGRLVLIDKHGDAQGRPTAAQIDHYIRHGSPGRDLAQWDIGIRYTDKNGNDVAVSLTPAELAKISR